MQFLFDPEEDMHDLIDSLLNKTLITVSDGGADKTKGSYGFLITTQTGERLVKAQGPVFGLSPGSYRSEGTGLLAIV